MVEPLDRYNALLPVVHRILLEQWDPLGVNEHPEAEDEYDSYIPGVIKLLLNGSTASAIAVHLGGIAVDIMGLASNSEHELKVAQALLSAAAAALGHSFRH